MVKTAPKSINNKIKVLDKTEKEVVLIQRSTLWKLLSIYVDRFKVWSYWGISGTFASTFGLNYLTTSTYKEALGIKSEWWPGVVVVGCFVAFVFFAYFSVRIRTLSGNGSLSLDNFIEGIFSSPNRRSKKFRKNKNWFTIDFMV